MKVGSKTYIIIIIIIELILLKAELYNNSIVVTLMEMIC